jgi:parallel beta-helix repeat protein
MREVRKMRNNMFKKGLVLGIIVLFVGAGVIPSTVGIKKEKTTIATLDSPGYIQDLIDNASDGDTIYIPSGTYYENIIINKSISLVGEDKNTTIIDGGGVGSVIHVSADWVNISGFTIQNSEFEYGVYHAGIEVHSQYNTIADNIISSNDFGIFGDSSSNTIIDNVISNNHFGIGLVNSSGNTIMV